MMMVTMMAWPGELTRKPRVKRKQGLDTRELLTVKCHDKHFGDEGELAEEGKEILR
jgi:hypothetical protein